MICVSTRQFVLIVFGNIAVVVVELAKQVVHLAWRGLACQNPVGAVESEVVPQF